MADLNVIMKIQSGDINLISVVFILIYCWYVFMVNQ